VRWANTGRDELAAKKPGTSFGLVSPCRPRARGGRLGAISGGLRGGFNTGFGAGRPFSGCQHRGRQLLPLPFKVDYPAWAAAS
jgi:hypothetical protein